MRFSVFTAALLAAATAVSAETFNVLVGQAGALTYEPASVTAKAGDIVNFQFMSKNHTVTQSTFTSPCVPKANGVDSGFQFIPAGAAQKATWSITVNNDTAPMWFFCNQGPHCKAGMVFAINPNAEKTIDAFKASAAAGGGATAGPNAVSAASTSGSSYGGAAAPGPAAGAANAGGAINPASPSSAAANANASAASQEVPNFGGAASRSVSFGAAALAVVAGIALL
jgi:plastocyanin